MTASLSLLRGVPEASAASISARIAFTDERPAITAGEAAADAAAGFEAPSEDEAVAVSGMAVLRPFLA
jgi:hypothetical protein